MSQKNVYIKIMCIFRHMYNVHNIHVHVHVQSCVSIAVLMYNVVVLWLFVCCWLVSTFKEGESGLVHHPEFLKQGLLYVQDVAKKGEN